MVGDSKGSLGSGIDRLLPRSAGVTTPSRTRPARRVLGTSPLRSPRAASLSEVAACRLAGLTPLARDLHRGAAREPQRAGLLDGDVDALHALVREATFRDPLRQRLGEAVMR